MVLEPVGIPIAEVKEIISIEETCEVDEEC